MRNDPDRDSGIAGDRPLEAGARDMLGFAELAEALATALVDRASRDGIVVGLEGAWGSGKSSLLALTVDALKLLPEGRRPQVVSFGPWLIGNRDALLTALFADLARTVDEMQHAAGDATGVTAGALKGLADDLRRFGGRLGALAPVASLASLAGIPGANWLEKGLKAAREIGKQEQRQVPLAETKARIDRTLKKLDRPIIVTIDDVDRLEPTEIAEVLRLVRSVADFHNVVYVLCYDPDIVAEAVQTAMRIGSGRAYLEKIVQIPVSVPAPEPFALRRMFAAGLAGVVRVEDDASERRLADVVDVEGGRCLDTPRAVNRALDALRFVWPALEGRVDAADLVWLQLIRIGNPSLHAWIETYSAMAAAVAGGRVSLGANARTDASDKLQTAIGPASSEEARRRLGRFLPGIGAAAATERSPALYRDVSERDRSAAITGRRLASPDHYRLYFALANPSGAILDSDLDALAAALDSGAEATVTMLGELALVSSSTLGTRLEATLDRIRTAPPEGLDARRCATLLAGMADILDEPSAVGDVHAFLGPPCWRTAERLLPVLRGRMADDGRSSLIAAFQEGRAIAWLTAVFRSETFGHGRYGDQRRPEHEWLLSEEEYDEVVTVMQARYEELGIVGVMSTLDPLSMLFAWSQSGAEERVRALVRDHAADDEAMLVLLEVVASTIRSSSAGDQPVIRHEVLGSLFDPDIIGSRLIELAQAEGPLAVRAAAVAQRIERGRRF